MLMIISSMSSCTKEPICCGTGRLRGVVESELFGCVWMLYASAINSDLFFPMTSKTSNVWTKRSTSVCLSLFPFRLICSLFFSDR